MKKTIVCKIGGSIVDGIDPSFVEDVKKLRAQGFRIVLVHGGADQVTTIAEKLGKKQQFITSPEGIKSRYTDGKTAEIFMMVMSGMISKKIVQSLQKNGINAVSLTGLDGMLFRAERKKRLVVIDDRKRKVAIEGGYTGKINLVNTEYLDSILDSSIVPVISPIAAGEDWEFLNIDGDRACSHIAGAIQAETAVFLTDTEGLIMNGSLIDKLTTERAKELLSQIGSGMDKKIIAASEAVEMGTKRSVVSSGLRKNPLQNALIGGGTQISNRQSDELLKENEVVQ